MVDERDGVNLGRRLLGQVRETQESLVTLLCDIQAINRHQQLEDNIKHEIAGDILGIPSIDKLLQQGYADKLESAQNEQLQEEEFASESNATSAAATLEELMHRDRAGPFQKLSLPIIEISSEKSCSGKTQLLYYITAIAILPAQWNGVDLNGKNSATVVIDCEGRFGGTQCEDLYKAVKAYVGRRIQQHLKENATNYEAGETDCDDYHERIRDDLLEEIQPEDIGEVDIDELIQLSLNHVHIFRPQSSESLLATLDYLPKYLFDTFKHFSSDRPLDAILVDDISAFYWIDKMHSTTAQLASQEEKYSFIDAYTNITRKLQALSVRLSAKVIVTNITLGEIYPIHLPQAYTHGFFSCRIALFQNNVAQFHDSLTLMEAWDDRKSRQKVVDVSGFSGKVENKKRRKEEWFWFWIGDGIVMEQLD